MDNTPTDKTKHLSLGLHDFRAPSGRDVYRRSEPLREWGDAAGDAGTFQFLRHHVGSPGLEADVIGFGGQHYKGINLASQDYLGLSRDARVCGAAIAAIEKFGCHSAGSEPMGGGLLAGKHLERQIAELTRSEHVVLFPTGWAAGYGAIKGIVRPCDHIVLDALAHDCLQHGANASTGNVSFFAHNDAASLDKRLGKIRRANPEQGLFVVTESLFSMDSDTPDFRQIVDICKSHGAYIFVDIAHDLGALGPAGRGALEEQGVLPEIDFLIGSFSKVFAAIGGFFACRSRAIDCYVRGFSGSYTFSNFLMPGQIASVSQAFDIIASGKGDVLRQRTLANACRLREALAGHGLTVLGRVSPMVIPYIGAEPLARTAYRLCLERGLILNCIEYPACRRGAARFRLQVTPDHTHVQLESAADIVAGAIEEARQLCGKTGERMSGPGARETVSP